MNTTKELEMMWIAQRAARKIWEDYIALKVEIAKQHVRIKNVPKPKSLSEYMEEARIEIENEEKQ